MLLIHLIAIKSLSLWPAVTVHSAEAYTCLYWSYPRDMGKLYASLSALLGWDRSSGRRACRRGMAESPCNIQPNWTRVATCAGPILQQLSVALTSLALASWRQRVVQAVVRVRFFPRIDLFCKDAGFCLAFSEAWFLLVNECSGWMTIGRKSLILIYSLYVNERERERCIIIYIYKYKSYNCILIYLAHQEPTDL